MGKARTAVQYNGILLVPINYPPYYGKSRRFLKYFDFKTEEEIVSFQERLQKHVNRQMDERWDALCAHYELDPNGADRWINLVIALIQHHEPELCTPAIRLDAHFAHFSRLEFQLHWRCDEHCRLLAHILAIKHVPGFSEAPRPRQRTTFSNDELTYIALCLGELAEWINRDQFPALAGTGLVERLLALLGPDRKAQQNLVSALGSETATKLKLILNSASRQGTAKCSDELSEKAIRQLLVDVLTARDAVRSGNAKPRQLQLFYGVMPDLSEKMNKILVEAGLPDLE